MSETVMRESRCFLEPYFRAYAAGPVVERVPGDRGIRSTLGAASALGIAVHASMAALSPGASDVFRCRGTLEASLAGERPLCGMP